MKAGGAASTGIPIAGVLVCCKREGEGLANALILVGGLVQ